MCRRWSALDSCVQKAGFDIGGWRKGGGVDAEYAQSEVDEGPVHGVWVAGGVNVETALWQGFRKRRY